MERVRIDVENMWVVVDGATIPFADVHEARALAILGQFPGGLLQKIIAAAFDAGRERGKEELRAAVRPSLDDLTAGIAEAVETMRSITARLPKEE